MIAKKQNKLIPQLEKFLNLKTILEQLERASKI